jgi:hypothetical protein
MLKLAIKAIEIAVANSVSVKNFGNHAAIICQDIAERSAAGTADTSLLL